MSNLFDCFHLSVDLFVPNFSFIVFAMSFHAFRAPLLSCFQTGQNSRPNLIHLAYTRRSSTEEDDELGPLSSRSSGDDDAEEFCERLAWVLAVAPPGL